jgi:hypothetical protein
MVHKGDDLSRYKEHKAHELEKHIISSQSELEIEVCGSGKGETKCDEDEGKV